MATRLLCLIDTKAAASDVALCKKGYCLLLHQPASYQLRTVTALSTPEKLDSVTGRASRGRIHWQSSMAVIIIRRQYTYIHTT